MSEKALYRKYRPKNFTEVLGQEHVVKALQGALEQKNVGHAYLFAGTRGTGKTSLARIFASEIGTKDRDLHEIDAASNRGVDDIRALREEVHILPFESTRKVYIVDEVHMLTKEAFNALLKTLEEPPNHVVFILATTELEKLPDTIISRCQTFTFKKPSVEILKKMVLKVAKSEGLEIETSSAELIALLASGSFRDALGHLQQVLASSDGRKISPEDVEAVTGAPRSGQLLRIVDAVAEGDLDTSLHVVQELAQAGTDMKIVLLLLLRLVRAVLLLRAAPSLKSDIQSEFTEEEYTSLGIHATTSKTKINSKLLISLLDAHMRTGTTFTPQLPLEIALIEHLEVID